MRILIRVVLWPVRMALTVLEWVVLFVAHFVGIGCYLLSGGCVVIALAGWLMGLAPAGETAKILGIGFGFFACPTVGVKLLTGIGSINQKMYGLF